MFKVTFWKTIWNGNNSKTSTMHSAFKRVEVLPFTPSTRIQFSWPLQLLPIAPTVVCWSFEEQEFVCTMPDEFPHKIGCDLYDYEWLVKQTEECGWILAMEYQHTEELSAR